MEAEEYLNRIPMWASKKNSLEAIRDFLGELGDPDDSMKLIHVAGTNGKGSVCAYLTSVLRAAGYRTGTFISPHLVYTRERFLIDGRPVEAPAFEKAFLMVKTLADRMTAEGYEPPTYFEFLFYMFLVICQEKAPDFVILETGMGGLLDTTNVIRNPLLTVITSISMDHMQYLGHTVEDIAAQKAGILKRHVPVVCDCSCPQSTQVVRAAAERLDCPWYPVGEKDYRFLGRSHGFAEISVETPWGARPIRVFSEADYQMNNGAVAVFGAEILNQTGAADITPDQIRRGMEGSRWPGRMEEVLPGIYVDGAHNGGGMEALTRTVRRMVLESRRSVSLMFGVVSDKEYHRMIEELCRDLPISRVTIAHMATERSADMGELAEIFRREIGCPVEVFDTVREAWDHFLSCRGDGLAFCAGSLYLVGEIKEILAAQGGRT